MSVVTWQTKTKSKTSWIPRSTLTASWTSCSATRASSVPPTRQSSTSTSPRTTVSSPWTRGARQRAWSTQRGRWWSGAWGAALCARRACQRRTAACGEPTTWCRSTRWRGSCARPARSLERMVLGWTASRRVGWPRRWHVPRMPRWRRRSCRSSTRRALGWKVSFWRRSMSRMRCCFLRAVTPSL